MLICFMHVSNFERQELVNTLDQVKREVSQRYDLKGTNTAVDLDKENIFITTNSELTLNAVNDIIRQKALKRNLGGQPQPAATAKTPTSELPVDEPISDNEEPIDE